MKLNKNLGNIDRIVRLLVALIFAALYFTGTVSGTLGIVLLVLGVVFAVTAVFSFCPIYYLFKFSTAGK